MELNNLGNPLTAFKTALSYSSSDKTGIRMVCAVMCCLRRQMGIVCLVIWRSCLGLVYPFQPYEMSGFATENSMGDTRNNVRTGNVPDVCLSDLGRLCYSSSITASASGNLMRVGSPGTARRCCGRGRSVARVLMRPAVNGGDEEVLARGDHDPRMQ